MGCDTSPRIMTHALLAFNHSPGSLHIMGVVLSHAPYDCEDQFHNTCLVDHILQPHTYQVLSKHWFTYIVDIHVHPYFNIINYVHVAALSRKIKMKFK
jgi:hypothetical protein